MNAQTLRNELVDHLPRIRRIVRAISHDEELVDEVTQECCIRLIEKEQLWTEPPRKLPQWINAVTRNLTLDFMKKRKVEITQSMDIAADDPAVEPEGTEFSEEHIRWVLAQFGALSEGQKQILHLKYFENMKTGEIAERLDVTHQTVSKQVERALTTLKKRAHAQGLLAILMPWTWFREINERIALMTQTGKTFAVGTQAIIFIALGSAGTIWVNTIIEDDTSTATHNKAFASQNDKELKSKAKEIRRLKATIAELNTQVNGSLAIPVVEGSVIASPGSAFEGSASEAVRHYQETIANLQADLTHLRQATGQQSDYTGVKKFFDKNGNLRKTIDMVKGVPHGLLTVYNADGIKQSTTECKDGVPHGLQTAYDVDGIKQSTTEYKHGVQDGVETRFYPDGSTKRTTDMVEGEYHGKETNYNEKGKITREIELQNNIYHGKETKYDDEGRITRTTQLVDGKYHGKEINYDSDGKIQKTIDLVKGKYHGDELRYDSEGRVTWKLALNKGKYHGVSLMYHPNGTASREMLFKDGKSLGVLREYSANGDLESENYDLIYSNQDFISEFDNSEK